MFSVDVSFVTLAVFLVDDIVAYSGGAGWVLGSTVSLFAAAVASLVTAVSLVGSVG